MSNFKDFIGGGGSATYPTFFLTTSQTWVPPQDGNICIHVVGAGGSGSLGGWTNRPNMRGGGAGGYCKKNTLAVTTSGSFTVVLGSGGTPALNNSGSTSTSIDGVDGGNSTVAGTGLGSTLTANGGQRGARVSLGSGGTASGGDLNYTGGTGKNYAGGGGVNLTNTGTTHNATNIAWNSGFYAGYPQVQGNFWESKEGVLMGGMAGRGFFNNSAYLGNSATMPSDGEPLAGGGNVLYGSSTTAIGSVYGGDGGFGAGGGACTTRDGDFGVSGRGGNGIVVIQYIP